MLPRLMKELVEALTTREEVEAVLVVPGPPEWTLLTFLAAPLAIDVRRSLLNPRSTLLDLEISRGGPCDDGELNDGTVYSVVYKKLDEFSERAASATSEWGQLSSGEIGFDRGRLGPLKARLSSYPEALRSAVVSRHWPLLGSSVANYRDQAARAVKTSDWFAAQHRTAAFLASVFELVFAVNSRPHPGPYRLAELSAALPALPSDWSNLLSAVDRAGSGARVGLVEALDRLAAAVQVFLGRQGLIESSAQENPRKVSGPVPTAAPSGPPAPQGILSVYTDGGCIGNPGKGAWAYLVDDGDLRVEDTDGDPLTTNNKMELQAVISALAAISAKTEWKGRPIRIHTDSQYVRNGITAWIKTWASNGWKTASKEPVKNQDLWMELQKWDSALKPEWKWVKGHAGNPNNERCDALVRRTMEQM